MNIKEKAKELCTCHHKCKDTKDCVVEDDALLLINQDKSNNFEGKSNNELFKQALVEGVNRHIDKDLQIEEMAEIIEEKNCIGVLCSECEFFNNSRCSKLYIAKALYNAGYRKQEWISVEDRLPEKGGTYLVHYHDDVIGEYVITRNFWENPKKFAPMEYFEEHTGRKALHWMPLPEAPKMKGGEE